MPEAVLNRPEKMDVDSEGKPTRKLVSAFQQLRILEYHRQTLFVYLLAPIFECLNVARKC